MADGHTFIYVDDSGNDEIGVSLTGLLLDAEHWSTCLGYWMALRQRLESQDGLPKHYEIHSNAFLSAHPLKDVKHEANRRSDIVRSRLEDPALDAIALARAQLELADIALNRAISTARDTGKGIAEISSAARMNAPDVADRLELARSLAEFESISCLGRTPSSRTRRRAIYKELLDQINAFPGARVITVTATNGAKGTLSKLYGHLLEVLDAHLASQGRWGTVIVDGTPSARTLYYRDAHRNLDISARRVLEDEVMRSSGESHFIQMADICAHSAFGLRQRKDTQDRRYLRLKDVVITADSSPFTADRPGFFALPKKNDPGY